MNLNAFRSISKSNMTHCAWQVPHSGAPAATLHPLAAAVGNNLSDLVADSFVLSYERAQVVSFTHPVGSTMTGIISGSVAPLVATHGTFLFDRHFYLLNALSILILIALIWLGFHLLQVNKLYP